MGLTVNGDQISLRSKRRWLLLLIAVALLALLAAAYFLGWFSPVKGKAESEASLPALKVVVSNGCGIEKLAADYSEHIKDRNIEVVRLTSTPMPIYNKSIIVVKNGDDQDLRRLQKMTGIQRYTMALDPDYEAPFLLILGADFEEFIKE